MPMPAESPPIPHRLAVRRLIRGSVKASLASRLAEGDGWPYGSLVTTATAQDGSVILLLSGLSDHTRNIAADPRVSLLFDGTDGFANPQQGPRVTVLGRAERDADAGLAQRFLARHPGAQLYAGFGDFAFYRVTPLRAHWVGGFARAVWLEDRLTVEAAAAAAMAVAEPGILDHMNSDHGDALDLMAKHLLGQDGQGWRMVAIDADGCDLARDEVVARLVFADPIDGAAAARRVLVDLAQQARSAAGAG